MITLTPTDVRSTCHTGSGSGEAKYENGRWDAAGNDPRAMIIALTELKEHVFGGNALFNTTIKAPS